MQPVSDIFIQCEFTIILNTVPPYVNSEQVGVDLAMAAGVPVLLTEYNSGKLTLIFDVTRC